MLLDVTAVLPRAPSLLELVFENGERRLFDVAPLLEERTCRLLRDRRLFSQARVENGTVTWPGGIEIAPETLYDRSQPVDASPELQPDGRTGRGDTPPPPLEARD